MINHCLLSPKYLERYADVLIWGLKTARKASFRKKDVILIRHHLDALPMAEILHARLLAWGMNPVLQMAPTPTLERNFFTLADKHQLTFQTPGDQLLIQHLNGSIFLYAPASLTHLSTVDPGKIGRHAVARKPLRDIMDERESKGLFGWTLCMLPTAELARQAGADIETYTDQIVKACWLHRRDPVAQWQTIHQDAGQVKKWLDSLPISFLQIESARIDLKITPGAQRRWIGISGHNIPSFEIFLSPDWHGTEGIYYANLPSYRNGNLVEGVHLEFKKGRAVHIEATKGEAFVRQQLAMDQGAGKVGEFSLTDKRFSKINRFMATTLYDENFGGAYGNCHIAVGSSYIESFAGDPAELTSDKKQRLGFNDSALHWDLVNTEKKRVAAHLTNGRQVTIYENGQFTY